jgi:hypothetical protein
VSFARLENDQKILAQANLGLHLTGKCKDLIPSNRNYIADMDTKDLILKEIEVFPEPYLEEILDFVRFLKDKAMKTRMESAILSESVLSRDWLNPEEDEARKGL